MLLNPVTVKQGHTQIVMCWQLPTLNNPQIVAKPFPKAASHPMFNMSANAAGSTFQIYPESNLCCYYSGLSHSPPTWVLQWPPNCSYHFCPCLTSACPQQSSQREPSKVQIRCHPSDQNLPMVPSSHTCKSKSPYNGLHHLPVLTCFSSFPRSLPTPNWPPSFPKLADRFLPDGLDNLLLPLPRILFPRHLHSLVHCSLHMFIQNVIFSMRQTLATL